MLIVECQCGTLYHLEKPSPSFKCGQCSRRLSGLPEMPVSEEHSAQDAGALRLVRWVFVLGCTVGFFLLFMMIPTSLMFEGSGNFALLLLELVLGTMLVCASLAFYLLSLQVQSMQHTLNLHMNNLRIFADQISHLRKEMRRRGWK